MKRMLVLNLALTLVLAACGGATPVPSATLPPTEKPSPTLEPADTLDQTSPLLTFPEVNCCKSRTVEPGKYEIPSWLGIPLSMQISEGWRVWNEEAALLFALTGKGRNSINFPSQLLAFIAVPGRNPRGVLTSIKNAPELIPESEIIETTISGFPGLQLDISAKDNPGYEGDKEADIPPGVQFLPSVNRYFTPGFLWTTSSPKAYMRFIVLDIAGQSLLLQIESPPAEFEAFAGEADQVLQTLKLRR